ncbi:GNAT family N-acetyltransferase [Paenibacillus campi]|uniref:GNAT family N-acetyltransferase n=1 Tax=Paenibacillus campi TaxID=3106031 RepID=UPI002AFF8501|nr:GNAT family N-acetyltransferase [Paenibacillus sp. SGZ-1014]
MIIRHARPGDEVGIAIVHVHSWQTTYAGLLDMAYLQQLSVSQRQQAWQEQLKRMDEQYQLLVLEDERGGITGFISGGTSRELAVSHRQREGEIYALYLLSSVQGNGWGGRLLARMLQWMQQQHYDHAIVWALRDNPAVRFYEHYGAVPYKEQTIKIGGQLYRETALRWSDLHKRSYIVKE